MIVPDPNEYLKPREPREPSRLDKAKEENERLKKKLADKQRDDMEAPEAERLERENEDLKKQLGGR
jgi:cell shape-determining protein MreC